MVWYDIKWYGIRWDGMVSDMVLEWVGYDMGFPFKSTMVLVWSSYITLEWVPAPHRYPKMGDWSEKMKKIRIDMQYHDDPVYQGPCNCLLGCWSHNKLVRIKKTTVVALHSGFPISLNCAPQCSHCQLVVQMYLLWDSSSISIPF